MRPWKKVVVIGAALCMLNPPLVFAAQASPSVKRMLLSDLIFRRMQYIMSADVHLNIDSNGKATVTSQVTGYKGTTTKVEIAVSLQWYKDGRWQTLRVFSNSSNSYHLMVSGSQNVKKGYSYRATSTISAYSSSSVERRTVSSESKQH